MAVSHYMIPITYNERFRPINPTSSSKTHPTDVHDSLSKNPVQFLFSKNHTKISNLKTQSQNRSRVIFQCDLIAISEVKPSKALFCLIDPLVLIFVPLCEYKNLKMVNQGDNAWVMVSGMLVMFMTPGVGFFYGGMVNKKNVLSTIAYCLLVFCIASITWALVGFSLAFGGETAANGFIGDCTYCGLRNLALTLQTRYSPTIPFTTFFFFQTMFAAITPAIFIGSVIGRIRIPFLIALTVAFNIIVYAPIAYWTWNHNGWLFKKGAIDFAGGNVIHIPAGFAGLASAVYLGYGEKKSQKQNSSSISLTLIGTAILWMGWFGFNGGSALASGQVAAVAITNSHLAACAAGLGWAGMQYLISNKPSIVGWCCGSVCGLVAITPGAGFVSLWSSLVIGALGGVLSYLFCHAKSKYFEQLADTLDVFGCHGISAMWGGIAAGCFATPDSGNIFTGLFYGNGYQFGVNILGIVVCAAYSFAVTWLLYFLLGKVMEAKVSEEQEHEGLDYAIHGEENDPLTEKDVINILKSANNFNSVGNLILSNVDLKPQPSLKVVNDQSSQRIAAVETSKGHEIKLETNNPASAQAMKR